MYKSHLHFLHAFEGRVGKSFFPCVGSVCLTRAHSLLRKIGPLSFFSFVADDPLKIYSGSLQGAGQARLCVSLLLLLPAMARSRRCALSAAS